MFQRIECYEKINIQGAMILKRDRADRSGATISWCGLKATQCWLIRKKKRGEGR